MEEKFLKALAEAREKAAALGVRIRPVTAMADAFRCLDGHKPSDGFNILAQKGRLDLSLEAISTQKQFTALFTDDQANEALNRLLEANYYG